MTSRKYREYLYCPLTRLINRDANKKYDKDGFDINGINKNTGTFFNKKGYIKEYISKNIDWLEDKYEYLKLYN